MLKFSYRATQHVEAARWDQDNLDEMKELLAPHVDHDMEGPQVYSEYIEEYPLNALNKICDGYRMLLLYAGDDMEVDPGQWVVCYDDGELEIMHDELFHKIFEKD